MRSAIIRMSAFILILSGGHVSAQDYIWPTDASRALSSTFAEFRPGHFHSGIDIKTWNREGYKVYAVEDGYISRIRVSPFGYGKVIYQRLDDGNTAVYAHLLRFSDDIDDFIWVEQNAAKKYRLDRHFKSGEYPVRKGDVIGYTGKSASKAPHIHFEVRDEMNNPMNPLAFGLRIKDDVAPEPTALAVVPLSEGTEIDGGFVTRIFRLERSQGNVYTLPDNVRINGTVGFALSAFDRANGVRNRYAVSAIVLEIDGVQRYRANYQTFSFDETRMIELDREFRLWKKGNGLFHSLYRREYNTLPFYGSVNYGRIDRSLGEGEHSFRIAVSDYYGNESVVEGVLIYGERDRRGVYEDSEDEGIEESRSTGAGWVSVEYYDEHAAVIFESMEFLRELPSINLVRPVGGTVSLEVRRTGRREFQASARLDDMVSAEALRIIDVTSGTILYSEAIGMRKVSSRGGGQLISDDGMLTLSFGNGSLYSDYYGKVQLFEGNTVNEDVRPVTPFYSVTPDGVPMKGTVDVSLRYPGGLEYPGKLGIYFIDPKEGWTFLQGENDTALSTLSTKVLSLETFAALLDTTAPVIDLIKPGEGEAVRREKFEIEAIVKDEMSGIRDELSIIVKLDGEELIFEYHPPSHTVSYKPHEPVGKGEHTLSIRVVDNVGNETEVERRFSVR